jgi:hypothetical protein
MSTAGAAAWDEGHTLGADDNLLTDAQVAALHAQNSTTITGLLKGDGTAISAATAGTDYISPAGGTMTGMIILKAGTTGVGGAPLEFQSGSIETTPEAGDIEYDGKVFYGTPQAAERGFIPTSMISAVQAAYSLGTISANTVLQCFPTAYNAATLSGTTTYLIEGQILITKPATTTCTVGMGFITTSLTVTSLEYTCLGWTAAANGLATAQGSVHISGIAGKAVTATGTTVEVTLMFKGILRTNAGGTIEPALYFSASPGTGTTVNVGSYFQLTPIGTNTMTQIGTFA